MSILSLFKKSDKATNKPGSAAAAASARAAARANPQELPKVWVGHVGNAAAPGGQPPASTAEVERWKRARKAETTKRIDGKAMAWIERLPTTHRPLNTCQRYPHVVNGVAERWRDAVALTEYFEELLNTNRGGARKQRAGFPLPVKLELDRLRAYAQSRGKLV